MENELPADDEQCPPGALALGLDHSDFIAALAPKPVILLGQEKDYFDARGLEESFGRLQPHGGGRARPGRRIRLGDRVDPTSQGKFGVNALACRTVAADSRVMPMFDCDNSPAR
ncbi:MAG TPA: hypothetical protein PLP42_01780 [Acidobacteriota bacterium]|nr:hypothetical protein [Acidobacteriota bacterium]